jgi:hypothetical protein
MNACSFAGSARVVVCSAGEEDDTGMGSARHTERCQDCGTEGPSYDTVQLSLPENTTRLLCTRCFNTLMAKRAGVDFDHPTFAPILLEGPAGALHEFHFRTRHGGDHIALEAIEIREGSPDGYAFQVLGDPGQDPFKIFQRLFERMRRALGRTHIDEGEHGPQIAQSGESWLVRG